LRDTSFNSAVDLRKQAEDGSAEGLERLPSCEKIALSYVALYNLSFSSSVTKYHLGLIACCHLIRAILYGLAAVFHCGLEEK
jgi:hypothetical protein